MRQNTEGAACKRTPGTGLHLCYPRLLRAVGPTGLLALVQLTEGVRVLTHAHLPQGSREGVYGGRGRGKRLPFLLFRF